MSKPRIFLGSSAEQAKLLRAIARGLSEVADVEPWMTTFNPGRSALDRPGLNVVIHGSTSATSESPRAIARSSLACSAEDPRKIRGLLMGDS